MRIYVFFDDLAISSPTGSSQQFWIFSTYFVNQDFSHFDGPPFSDNKKIAEMSVASLLVGEPPEHPAQDRAGVACPHAAK